MVGDRFIAKITDMNENGAGIVKTDGMVVFVPGCVPGDEAEIVVTDPRKNYAIGKCLSLIKRSTHRVPSVCPAEPDCGGCVLGHISYELENQVKANTVRAALRRAGVRNVTVEDTRSLSDRYRYRNKMVVHLDPESHAFGYCKASSNEILPFRGCPLCPQTFSDIVMFFNGHPELWEGLQPTALGIRSGMDGTAVIVYTKKTSDSTLLRNELNRCIPGISSLHLTDPDRPTSVPLRDRIGDLVISSSSEAFRQVNLPAFELLLGIVKEFLGKRAFRTAADLYCGSGVIGLTLAKAYPDTQFYGIEINPDGIRDAKANAAANGLSNIEFYCGDAAGFRKAFPSSARPELVTVDPPRAGLSDTMLRELLSLAPECIVYVSCNPQTLARDLAQLVSGGYGIKRIVPVNLFPATKHIETVCCLYR